MLPNHTDAGPRYSSTGYAAPPTRMKIYMVTGPLSFVAVDLHERMKGWRKSDFEVLVMRLDGVTFIGADGLKILDDLMLRMQAHGLHMILCGASDWVKARLFEAGLDHFNGNVTYTDDISRALVEGYRGADQCRKRTSQS